MTPSKTPKKSKKFSEDLRDLRKLWPHLRKHRRHIYVAAALIPIISLLQMSLPLLVRRAIDEGILQKNTNIIVSISGIFLVVVVAEYLARAAQAVLTSLAIHRMILDMRLYLVRHILTLKAAFHDRSMSGALVTRATSDFDNLSESLNQGVLTSVVDCAVLLGSLVGLFVLDWRLALSSIVILPVVGIVVSWFSKALKAAMLDARKKIAALNAYTQECLYGHTTIKTLTGATDATRHFAQLNREFRDAQMSSVVLDAAMFSVIDGIASISVGLVLWVALAPWLGQWAISAGVIVAFVQYLQQLFEPLKSLGIKMAMLQGTFASVERIFGLLDEKQFVSGSQQLADLKGELVFAHVSFSYQSAGDGDAPTRHAIQDLSFRMAPGESVALVGATGSGKSTIIKLLCKMYDGYSGSIRIDGQELSDIAPAALQQHLAIVPQDIVLFDGTIAFNISMGDPSVTPAQIEAAAKAVGADQFIGHLPGQYQFEIREQGSNLSHGQRQLLTFARALARQPKMVILDEATSSIDSESEALVQSAIGEILRGRSVIVIAHRLSTIRKCDRILVIDQGRLIESGSHEQLLQRRGAYHTLHHALGITVPPTMIPN